MGAVVPLLATGTLIFVTAGGGGYSPLGALYQMIVASAAALAGGFVLVLKPPAGRRIAALLLVTAFPLLLFTLILAGAHQSVYVFPGGHSGFESDAAKFAIKLREVLEG